MEQSSIVELIERTKNSGRLEKRYIGALYHMGTQIVARFDVYFKEISNIISWWIGSDKIPIGRQNNGLDCYMLGTKTARAHGLHLVKPG